MAAGGTYDAFISYSHSMDGRLAPALRTGLEQLAKPWRRRRALRVFHDASGLGATPGLWSTIAAALDRTRYFLLLASPVSAASGWVQQEVGYFRSLRGAEAIFLVLTDGECRWDRARGDFDWSVSNAVPPQLSGGYREEPLFVDLRWARAEDQLDLRNPRFRQAIGDLAAPLHGMARDEIDAVDLQQYRAARRARRLATAGLVALTAASVAGATGAVINADRARSEARRADAGRLAALSVGYAAEQTDRAVLLAQHSLRRADTREGRLALATAMTRPAAGYGPLDGLQFFGQALAAGERRLLVGGSASGGIAVWEPGAAALPRVLTGQTASISELALSSDESALASVDVAGRLLVQSVDSGAARWRADGIADAVFTPSGDLLEAGLDGRVAMRALPGGQWRWSVPAVSPRSRTAADRAAVAMSPDGRWAAVAGSDARITLLDARSGDRRGSWPTGGSDANDLAFDPTSTFLLAGGDDGVARVWRVSDPRAPGAEDSSPITTLGGATTGLRRVAWARNGTTVATGSFDARTRLYDLVADRLLGELPGHAWPVVALAFGADGDTLWTGDRDDVRGWNLSTGRPDRLLNRDQSTVASAEFSRDGSVLATVTAEEVVLWRPREDFGAVVRMPGGGTDLALTPDGSVAVVVGGDAHVRRYATDDGRLLGEDRAGAGPVGGVDVAPDGRSTATVTLRGTVTVRDAADGTVRWETPLLADGHRVAYTSDGERLVVTGLEDRRVVLVDAATGAERGRWEVPDEVRPSAVAVTPDGQHVLVGRDDGRLSVLDSHTLQEVRTVLAHQNRIYAVAVAPDSSLVATGGFNGGGVSSAGSDVGLRLWDGATGQQVGQFVGHNGQVEALSFSPDGRWLVSGGFDGRTLLWPSYERWREQACATAGRDLTDEERRLLLGPDDRTSTVC